jgi:hypothetical protein
MTIEALLDRCDKVRETGPGKYVARCPAHDDRSPSLGLRECDDGRILIHCFAGCEVESVLKSAGLTFSDLYPEKSSPDYSRKPLRLPFDARQILATLNQEALVTAVIAGDILEHRNVDEETWTRLAVAVNRINTARALCAPARIGR